MQKPLWRPIEFGEIWLDGKTERFDNIAQAWHNRRKEIGEDSLEFKNFLSRLKREHAIETGIVENLYQLSRGITETFIENGFVASNLLHSDTNIEPKKVWGFLNTQFNALDLVFDFIKDERRLGTSFIKELHALITTEQEYTQGIDQLGRKIEIELIKGDFKKQNNNPTRADGTVVLYCPPEHVAAEMDKLVEICNIKLDRNYNPVVLAAWLHHAFSIIHPFQDGNGRVARLLASLILIKDGLFPFTILRDKKSEYLDALEKADAGAPQALISLFEQQQVEAIKKALGLSNQEQGTGVSELAASLKNKIINKKQQVVRQREEIESQNWSKLFKAVLEYVESYYTTLLKEFDKDTLEIYLASTAEGTNHFYYTEQIIEYAKKFDYFFQRNLRREWVRLTIKNSEITVNVVFTLHHWGFESSLVKLGAFVEEQRIEQPSEKLEEIERIRNVVGKLPPIEISLLSDLTPIMPHISSLVEDGVKAGISHLDKLTL